MELLRSIIGGGCGAAIVAGLFGLITWRLNRKAQKEDKAADRKFADCAARGVELKEQRKMLEALMVAERTVLYDRIKHLAKSYEQVFNLHREWVRSIGPCWQYRSRRLHHSPLRQMHRRHWFRHQCGRARILRCGYFGDHYRRCGWRCNNDTDAGWRSGSWCDRYGVHCNCKHAVRESGDCVYGSRQVLR